MEAKGNILMRKPAERGYVVTYTCANGIYLKVKLFAHSDAGAIGHTYALAEAIGYDRNFMDRKEILLDPDMDHISGHSVETNLFKKLKNSRVFKADEKRSMINSFLDLLNDRFFLAPDEFTKHGRILQ